MIVISYESLFSGTKLRSILVKALQYNNFRRICKLHYEDNKDVYLSDTDYEDHSLEDCFLKDLITAIEYTDFALDVRYKRFSRKVITGTTDYSKEELACYVVCALKIAQMAFGGKYVRGIKREERTYIKNFELPTDTVNVVFEDDELEIPLQLLGDIATSQQPRKGHIFNLPTDKVKGF